MYSSSVQIEAGCCQIYCLILLSLPEKSGRGDPGQAGRHDGEREGMSETKIKSSPATNSLGRLRRAGIDPFSTVGNDSHGEGQ